MYAIIRDRGTQYRIEQGQVLEIALIELETLFEVQRDIAPRPADTLLEEDLYQAVRLAAAEWPKIGPPPDLSVEELAASAANEDVG